MTKVLRLKSLRVPFVNLIKVACNPSLATLVTFACFKKTKIGLPPYLTFFPSCSLEVFSTFVQVAMLEVINLAATNYPLTKEPLLVFFGEGFTEDTLYKREV